MLLLPLSLLLSKPLRPKPTNNILVRKLFPSQLQGRRYKGLCYTYDENVVPGHKCNSKFFLLVHEEGNCDDMSPQLQSQFLDYEPLPSFLNCG